MPVNNTYPQRLNKEERERVTILERPWDNSVGRATASRSFPYMREPNNWGDLPLTGFLKG